jgi:hypothetical protein
MGFVVHPTLFFQTRLFIEIIVTGGYGFHKGE